MQIRLHDSATAWRCEISLVKRYAYSPTSNKNSPLYPWVEFDNPILTPFVKLKDKSKMDQGIRSAQIATLNPQVPDPKSFINCDPNHSIDVQFSPNIITLDIYAPGLLNLSFYDLPGVISQTPDGNRDTVKLIETLNLEYIKQENTIVLLTVPMESDIDNSKASALLRQSDASYRTVGVLTKPDRLQSDDRADGWKAVLQDKAFRMGHGYFVVKQLSQTELAKKLGHVDARLAEQQFFISNQWTGRFGHDFADQLGTANLQLALSRKLAQLIFTIMPSLEQKVYDKLADVNDELAGLPIPPPNALETVRNSITKFEGGVRDMMIARGPNNLSDSWRVIKNSFNDAVFKTQRPRLMLDPKSKKVDSNKTRSVPYTPSKKGTRDDAITVSDDEVVTPVNRKRKSTAVTPKSKKAVKRECENLELPRSGHPKLIKFTADLDSDAMGTTSPAEAPQQQGTGKHLSS